MIAGQPDYSRGATVRCSLNALQYSCQPAAIAGTAPETCPFFLAGSIPCQIVRPQVSGRHTESGTPDANSASASASRDVNEGAPDIVTSC